MLDEIVRKTKLRMICEGVLMVAGLVKKSERIVVGLSDNRPYGMEWIDWHNGKPATTLWAEELLLPIG